MMFSVKSSLTALMSYSKNPTSLVSITYVVQNGIRLASSLVLTRLLAPEAYAVMGLVTSFSFVTVMLTDVGFQAFMLRHQRLSEQAFRDAMWTTRFLRSCVLAILFFCVAEPLGTWLQKPEAIFALKVFSLTFVIDGMVPISNITGLMDNRIRLYCLVDIAISAASFLIGFFFAWFFPNVYTLVFAALISQIARVILFRLFLPDSFMVWLIDFKIIVDLLKFGRYIVASSLITLVILQVDKLGLSRVLETERLGAYFLAVNIASVPRGLASAISSKSLYPAYSRSLAHRDRFDSRELYTSRRLLDKMFSISCLIGFFISPLLISFFYDTRYTEAGLFLGILFLGFIPLLWNFAINEFLVASGWTSTTFKANVARLFWVLAIALPFLIYEREMEFLTMMAFTEFVAYFYLLTRMCRLRIINWKHEAFCICFALISMIVFGFSSIKTLGLAFVYLE